ncbi:MAG: pyrroline-5-carboxylate reductase [Flavobacteriaceae bacterium]|nr:pyrroline-5-carboxylate reductase [Flavobacteriaceae bacterium]
MKVAIIGAGNLGLAIANGLIRSNAITQLYLTKREVKALTSYTEYENVYATADNVLATNKSDIVIIAVQPRQTADILEEIRSVLTDKHVLISVVTGFSIAKIESIVGENTFVIRSMPNTAIEVGESMTCLCSNQLGKQRIAIAEAIFNRLGTSLIIPENQMQAATVICASGIAFWMRLIRATTQGAIQLGFEADEAHQLAMQTSFGAAKLLIDSGKHPEEEIDRVTTPRGCTISGLNEMEHQGLSSSLIKGIVTSFDKINDIKNT